MNIKFILLLITVGIFTSNSYSQTVKLDTLVGSKGLFSKFQPKEITSNQKLSFNMKMTYTITEKNGKIMIGTIYFNTKHGYFGILNTKDENEAFNPNDKNFNFIVYSHTLKNFIFTTDRKGKKKVMSIPFNPNNHFKMDEIALKKENLPVKKFTSSNLDGYPFNNSKTTSKDKVIVYLNENAISNKIQKGKQLSFAGIGFYEFDGKTVLSMNIENNGNVMTLTKLEKVDIKLNGSEFNKQEMGGMEKTMEEMMKKIKKQ
jgi:hypothetical protein